MNAVPKPSVDGKPSVPNQQTEDRLQDSPTKADRIGNLTDYATGDTGPDPFELASLRLGQDFASTVGVKKVLTTVPCRKPNSREFVRVRPGEEWRIETAVFEDKINREIYLVDRGLWGELAGDVRPACLFLTINRQGDVFLWRAKLPGPDGKSNTWNELALAAARLAETRWIRVQSNMTAGVYDTFEATGKLPHPEWPDLPFAEILRLSFRDRFITDMDHPMLRALRGEA